MHKVLGYFRNVVVNYMCNMGNIDSARRYICGYENAMTAFREALQCLITLCL